MSKPRHAAIDPALIPPFTPVPNRTIKGWTAAKQRGFIEALAATGSVLVATKAMGMSHCGVYKLRHAPDGAEFAAAWDAAVNLGAQRVRDVLIDQAIHGTPERVLIGKTKVVERRRFNHRTMIWVLQHHMPHLYPSGSTTHRRGWQRRPEPSIEEVRESILSKIEAIERPQMREIAADPAKRAAYELLHGPTKWPDPHGKTGPGRPDDR